MKKTILTAVLAVLPRLAWAQDVPPEVQITPTTEEVEVPSGGNAIDLQNIVTTAAKGVTTVQEAPAIVTIITAEDLKQWGHLYLEDALTDVPGWGLFPAEGMTVPTIAVRGQNQSILYLHDGVSLFNASHNANNTQRLLPMESIKRVEVVTGPGGVLWGANSFEGILNVITKDADDVGGVEASAGYGDGRGNASDLRAYVMTGQTLLDGRLKVFIHGDYENYQGQIVESRQVIAHSPAPQPNGSALFGNEQTSDQPRSFNYTVDGKVSSGPLTLTWLWEDGESHLPTTFPLGIVQQNAPPGPWGGNDVNDPRKVGRDDQLLEKDRFAALEYRDRYANGRLGLNVKGYIVNTELNLTHFMFIPPSSALQGGATFNMVQQAYRSGITLDGDIALPYSNRLLFGGEAFREWEPGSEATFVNPDPSLLGMPMGSLNKLPFLCPHANATLFAPSCPVAFLFPTDRYVAAAFVSDQWRPLQTLTLDAGVREQAGFGEQSYDPLTLVSGTLVWNFIPNWHLKANYSEGFRPPVFSNTATNGAAVNLGGNPHLKNETSQAVQGEINARILRNVRKIRELTMRADYSYTIIDNLIVLNNGVYQNAGKRGISSAELLARLYLRGDHQLQLAYSFLQVADDAKGYLYAVPQHTFHINASFNLLKDRLDAVSTLWLQSATEDPNRIPGGTPFRQSGTCLPGGMQTPFTCGADALASNIALDRLPAMAFWNLGLRWRNAFYEGLELSAFVYNVLDQHWYNPDYFFDLNPQLELQPYPGFGRSAFAKAIYKF